MQMGRSQRSARRAARTARWILPVVLFLIGMSTAQAQDLPSPATPEEVEALGDQEIVVRGMTEHEQARAIARYVDGLTRIAPFDPLARYEPDVYCPAVFGLSKARAEQIVARMRLVAEEAGVRPAAPDCAPSAFVFLVDDTPSFLKLFKKKWPLFFAGAADAPSADVKGRGVSWQLTRDFDPQHMPLRSKGFGIRVVSGFQGGSRILSMISRAVAASVVVVERDSLVGLSGTQIADYALMRTLTDARSSDLRDTGQFSILGVIDTPMGSAAPASLTSWDFAYIKGRYKGDPRFHGARQASIIRAAIRRELKRQGVQTP